MGFVQKLATRNPRVTPRKQEVIIRRIPNKLTWKYVLDIRNWKWFDNFTKKK